MQAAGFATRCHERREPGTARIREVARKAGVGKSQIILDTGIGFGKSFSQNYELLQKFLAAGETRLSTAGGYFAEGLPLGATSGSGRQACVAGKSESGAPRQRLPRAS